MRSRKKSSERATVGPNVPLDILETTPCSKKSFDGSLDFQKATYGDKFANDEYECSTAAPSPFQGPSPGPFQRCVSSLPSIVSCGDLAFLDSPPNDMDMDLEPLASSAMKAFDLKNDMTPRKASSSDEFQQGFWSPRKNLLSDFEDESPKTPRRDEHPSASPCPPGAPDWSRRPPLLQALRRKCIRAVQSSLDQDPEEAQHPLWEYNWEPPLCCAIRFGCDADIIELLLDHGANVHAANQEGQTPMMILGSQSQNYAFCQNFLQSYVLNQTERLNRIQALLEQAGATYVETSTAEKMPAGLWTAPTLDQLARRIPPPVFA